VGVQNEILVDVSYAENDPDPRLLLGAAQTTARSTDTPPVTALLTELDTTARAALKSPTTIEDTTLFPSVDSLYSRKPTWKRIKDAVVVSADLKNSTQLSFGKYINTSAKIYEASTAPLVSILWAFKPAFVDIQGDGAFAIYHGERATERALCAAITIKTFSAVTLEPKIREILGEKVPDTGLKTGMDRGTLIARKLGVHGTNEPVWAGRPVNFAFKCAGRADAHGLIVTEEVFKHFASNDYVTHSCDHSDPPTELWHETDVEKLGTHSKCKELTSHWCENGCGDRFATAILTGQKKRETVTRA